MRQHENAAFASTKSRAFGIGIRMLSYLANLILVRCCPVAFSWLLKSHPDVLREVVAMIIACWRPSFGQMWTETEDDREAGHASLVSLMLVTQVTLITRVNTREIVGATFIVILMVKRVGWKTCMRYRIRHGFSCRMGQWMCRWG